MNNPKLLFSDKIFIAGASGMVGSAICRALRKLQYGDQINGGQILTPSRNELNLLDSKEVGEWFSINKPDIVIIAAAKVGGIHANSFYPADFILENLKIQNNLIENSWKFKTRRLLFLGSSCIYPKFAKQPIKEESLLSGVLEKTNYAYAIAKIAGIKLCQSLNEQYGFDAISIMPTNLYGPNDNYHPENSHVIASLIRKFCSAVKLSHNEVICWGSGSPMREFLHVDDLALAAIFVLKNWFPSKNNCPMDEFGNPIYHLNVGTGKDISIKELSEKIAFNVGFKGKIIWDKSKPDGTPKKLLDISKLRDLGWIPSIKFEDGLRNTIEDFTKNHSY